MTNFNEFTPASLVLRDVVKQYPSANGPVTAVRDFNLSIAPGELVTFLGPSGCGKTTTLRMVAGFEDITSGEVLLEGECINDVAPHKRPMSMVFQSYALFPHLSVRDNVAFGLKLKRMSASDINDAVNSAMGTMNILQYADRAPHELSGGQQQRVALARAVVMRPQVLLFDEPLSNLDAKLRGKMRSEIRRLQQELGITSIFVTHDQEEAMSMSDRIVVMSAGLVEQVGTPIEIYRHPVSAFVADFIGSANVLEVSVDAASQSGGDEHSSARVRLQGSAFTAVGSPAVSVNDERGSLILRPENLKVSTAPSTIDNVIQTPGTISAAQFFGDHIRYEVETPWGRLHVRVTGNAKLHHVGTDVFVGFLPEDSWLVPVDATPRAAT